MNEEQQNQFNTAIFWKAKQNLAISTNQEGEVKRLLAYYRSLTLQDRLNLLQEYSEYLKEPKQTPKPMDWKKFASSLKNFFKRNQIQ